MAGSSHFQDTLVHDLVDGSSIKWREGCDPDFDTVFFVTHPENFPDIEKDVPNKIRMVYSAKPRRVAVQNDLLFRHKLILLLKRKMLVPFKTTLILPFKSTMLLSFKTTMILFFKITLVALQNQIGA